MSSRDSRYSQDQPARVPKLHVRNRPSESSTAELLPLEITPCRTNITMPSSTHAHTASVSLPTHTRNPSTSTQTVRRGTPTENHSSTDTPKPKKKLNSNSVRGFFTMKEPSTHAMEEFKKQQRQQASERGTRPDLPSLQKLPSHVPPVNSKWDGLPRTSSTNSQHRASKTSHTRRSSAQTTSTAASTETEDQRAPSTPGTASTIDFDYGPPPSLVNSEIDAAPLALRHDSANALALAFSTGASIREDHHHHNHHHNPNSTHTHPLTSHPLAPRALTAPAAVSAPIQTQTAPLLSPQSLAAIAPWAEPPSPLARPVTARRLGPAGDDGIPEVKLPASSENLLKGAEGRPVVLNATPRLPPAVRMGVGRGLSDGDGVCGGGVGAGSGGASSPSPRATAEGKRRGVFSRMAGKKR